MMYNEFPHHKQPQPGHGRSSHTNGPAQLKNKNLTWHHHYSSLILMLLLMTAIACNNDNGVQRPVKRLSL